MAVFFLVRGTKPQTSDNVEEHPLTFIHRISSTTIQQLRTIGKTGKQHMLNIDAIHMREINMPLAHPFETSFGVTTSRRILLIELEAEGLTAWGECVAGEHPYFSDETIDTAWLMIENELGPSLLDANVERGGSCPNIFRQVRGHRMAKAALENAVWDLEAQVEQVSLAELLGGI